MSPLRMVVFALAASLAGTVCGGTLGIVAFVLAPSLFADAGVAAVAGGCLGLVFGAGLSALALILHTALEWRRARP